MQTWCVRLLWVANRSFFRSLVADFMQMSTFLHMRIRLCVEMYEDRSFIIPFKSNASMLLAHLCNFFHHASLYRQLYLTPLDHYPILASFLSILNFNVLVSLFWDHEYIKWKCIATSSSQLVSRYSVVYYRKDRGLVSKIVAVKLEPWESIASTHHCCFTAGAEA